MTAATVSRRPIWILVEVCSPRGPHASLYKTYRCTTEGCRAMCTVITVDEARPPPDSCEKCGARDA